MALPTPFYQDSLVTIYNADCRDILPQLPPASVGVAITDPPFRDGDLVALNNLMSVVRPLMATVAQQTIEMSHMVPILGTGQNKTNVVASNCTFIINGVTQAPSRINDPDMKLVGWATIFGVNPLGIIDPFSGRGGWILLAAKRAGQKAIGIELDIESCAQAAARIALG